ncbi:hypothetical protein [Hyphobacterium sp.]|uniref:hypothetical protein n=1 Tax=Hyphobacterium sp. TaxID=2004662 RepID=UPI003BABC0EF
MLKKYLAGAVLASTLGLAACTTTAPEPVTLACRAPVGEEFEIFRAVIARDHQTLARLSTQGQARRMLERRDPYINNHLWGNQGYTGGTIVGVLTQPPPCVIDMPRRVDGEGNVITTQRTIAVYQQDRFRSMTGGSVTFAPEQIVRLPGNRGQDYFRCELVQTSAGWRMTNLCGLPGVRGRAIGR